MKFSPPLEQGRLIKRYKRFMADIKRQDGSTVTIHCPNTGSMKNCLAPGAPVWFSDSGNPKRKYPHTWELTATPEGDLAGINTHRANPLVREAIEAGMIEPLQGFDSIRAEVKYGHEGSRIDFLVTKGGLQWYVEVKNVTLKEDGCGYFPDAISTRGTKHLRELEAVAEQNDHCRALLVFCVQHSGIEQVAPAAHIDSAYAKALEQAIKKGVYVLALKAELCATEFKLTSQVPVVGV